MTVSPNPPASTGRSKGMIYGILAVVIAAIVVIALLIWQPWKSDSSSAAGTETVTLGHNIAVTTTVPAGWKTVPVTEDGEPMLALVPDDETRASSEELQQATSALQTDPDAKPLHAVLTRALECAAPVSDLPAGQWRTGDIVTGTESDVTTARFPATYRVDETYCLQVVGVDAERGTSVTSHQGTDLAKTLVDGKDITAAAN